jgi:hypothetical protein
MRTTIRLDDALLSEAKAEAVRSGRTLTQVIEDALRAALARRGGRQEDPRSTELPTFSGRGLQPGVDLDSTASLLELMDERAAH